MAEYLASKNPQYYYNAIPVSRQKDGSPIEIQGCMKQHLIIFKPNKMYFCKEHLCDCMSCLQFDFENCTNEDVDVKVENARSEEEFFMRILIKREKLSILSQWCHSFLYILEV